MPAGLTAGDCITSSVTGNFPDSLRDWKYQPKFCSEPQLPQLALLPREAATLQDLPWFESSAQSTGLGINARHVRYHHSLWQELKPKVLQGVHTTLVLPCRRSGSPLRPTSNLRKCFCSSVRWPEAWARSSCSRRVTFIQTPTWRAGQYAGPIFADILPTTGGFAYPCVDCEPDPWRVLPASATGISITDTLPSGHRLDAGLHSARP